MRLKHFREAAGLTQREFAEKLGVSQPTVLRWENGKTEISWAKLEAAAQVLGCKPDELAGYRASKPQYVEPHPDWDAAQACWGTLSFEVAGEKHSYPISFAQRQYLTDKAFQFEQPTSWIEIETLNNSLLLVNLGIVEGLDLLTDDEEEAPHYYERRAYQCLSGDIPEYEEGYVSEQMDEFHAHHDSEAAADILRTIRVRYRTGKTARVYLERGSYDAIGTFSMQPESFKYFELPDLDGAVSHLVAVEQVGVIEIPRAGFLRFEQQEIANGQ